MKQTVNLTFSKGLDLKTDPWNVPFGNFLSLENSVFTTGGRLTKRPGYGLLTGNPPVSNYLTTLNSNLIAIGNTVNAFSSSLNKWVTKGTLNPCSLNVLPLIRNNLNQTQCDSVIAGGLVLTVYTQVNTVPDILTGSLNSYQFVIADAVTGQNIIPPSLFPVLTTGNIVGSPRVFIVGKYFVMVAPCLVSSTTFLQYVSIPINNPVNTNGNANTSSAQKIFSEAYVPISPNPGWDGAVSNNTLVIAYNTTAGAQGVHVVSITEAQIAAHVASTTVHNFNNAAFIGAIVSVCVDLTQNPNIFYISFWNNSTTNGYTAAVFLSFGVINVQFTPQQIITSTVVTNLASAAHNGGALIFSEASNAYSYDAAVPTNFINGITVSSAGVVGSAYVVIRSVGLASKAFIVDGTIYFLAAFQSTFQPSYFLINGTKSTSEFPMISAKLAYENGGGYLSLGLPSVTMTNNIVEIPYLFKDLVEGLNTLDNPQQLTAGGIYSQTGINLVSFTIGTLNIDTAEIAQNLHISGGYLSHFDGYLPVEHNFFLFPDSDQTAGTQLVYNNASTVTPTGTVTSSSFIVTAVSSVSGVAVGMSITGTAIPANTFITAIASTTITMSAAATGNHTAESLSIQGNIAAVPVGGAAGAGAYYYQYTYEWTDNQGLAYISAPSIPVTYTSTTGSAGTVTISVPTLRLTAKISNHVKIGIYRWSQATGVYNQITSITQPLLNDTTVDEVIFVDPYADAAIIGNSILYTTGGVVPDCNGPSFDICTLFDTRFWLVDNEDRNTLWVSKQVIEATPVEMSQDFTIYIAPNTGTVASTGPITAIAPMDDKLIIFKQNAIFYINGIGPNNLGTTSVGCSLGNYSQAIFITSVVGCTNQQSIVLTADGLMFQSDKGIWLLSRSLQASYIGAPVEAFNGSVVTSSNVIPETNYVVFSLSENNNMLMYDYFYGQWGTFTGVTGVSSTIYDGQHTLLTSFGQILQQTPGSYLDDTRPVLMSFMTSWINLAGLQGYERFYDLTLLAEYLSPHFLKVSVGYDYNASIVHQVIIAPKNFSSPVPSPFGVPTPYGSPANREQWRIDAKRQLCESFQLSISEVFDSSKGVAAGAGLNMSGVALSVGVKTGRKPIRGVNSAGMS